MGFPLNHPEAYYFFAVRLRGFTLTPVDSSLNLPFATSLVEHTDLDSKEFRVQLVGEARPLVFDRELWDVGKTETWHNWMLTRNSQNNKLYPGHDLVDQYIFTPPSD
ncbi:MAG: hypothetical protein UT32_C0042G0006 [Parcubacteria group bacterium GW2011_GWC2_39_14]|nr:MAG: hypothetical protein UT32_C0042G0006 [Parcubacteria group bacterium GW2011_GWC2_39_14]